VLNRHVKLPSIDPEVVVTPAPWPVLSGGLWSSIGWVREVWLIGDELFMLKVELKNNHDVVDGVGRLRPGDKLELIRPKPFLWLPVEQQTFGMLECSPDEPWWRVLVELKTDATLKRTEVDPPIRWRRALFCVQMLEGPSRYDL